MASWLKLETNILNNRKIKLIRDYPEGDTLFTLWIGMLCLAMEQENDRLYIADDFPYKPEDLARTLDIDLKTVQMGIEVFRRFKMVEINDDEVLCLPGIQEHQALDKLQYQKLLDADRSRRYRRRIKDEKAAREGDDTSNTSTVTRDVVTRHATDLDLDLDSDKEEEKNTVRLNGKNGDKPTDPFDKPPDKPPKPRLDVAGTTRRVIALLNDRAEKSHDPEATGNRNKISRLLKAGYTEEQMAKVVKVKSSKWKDDPKMLDYLRPSTLFGPEKFADYVAEYDGVKERTKSRGWKCGSCGYQQDNTAGYCLQCGADR